ncbi:MAG TPA: hypothetical protein DD723_09515 [Candidatus Omnitrophica bacterium]|nr:MAG: hypothetical protein A2Z81_02900 [Omnitrophica WOR_2 bacterium GWA2_45_18]HBR15755.1 hypothetical protein [Candidatus Omnitrophota bacterium]
MKKALNVMILATCLTGCATMSVPGQTSASPRLKADVVNMINMIEKAQAPRCSFKIADTVFDRVEGDSVFENWIVESCGKEIVYPVKLTPDPSGGTYFGVMSPVREQLKK